MDEYVPSAEDSAVGATAAVPGLQRQYDRPISSNETESSEAEVTDTGESLEQLMDKLNAL